MALEDYECDDVECWPENEPAFTLFRRVSSQWLTGPNGPTGLNYASVYPLMDRLDLDSEAWNEMLEDIRVLESGALAQMNEKK